MLHTSIFIVSILFISAQAKQGDPLRDAQQNMTKQALISYRYEALWPNPAGKVDTLRGSCLLHKTSNRYFTHDYIGRSSAADIVYINNQYQIVDHEDSTVLRYSDEDIQNQQRRINENNFILNSPLTLVNHSDWQYFQDTTIHEKLYRIYRREEMDTTINNKHIYVEQHLFLEPDKALVQRYERRAFLDGTPSQTIIYTYSDYELDNEGRRLIYNLPKGYKTVRSGDRTEPETLKVGEEAPDITAVDIDGKIVSLKSFRGRRVLLNFSVINCGYCKLALEHLVKEGFNLPEDMAGIYINPEDDAAEVQEYRAKIYIPFPAIASAKNISRLMVSQAFQPSLSLTRKARSKG